MKTCTLEQPNRWHSMHRLKCGEVYTWECTGEERERFAIECVLCADRPICKLTEFGEHMEIWHGSQSDDQATVQTACSARDDPGLETMDFEYSNTTENFETWLNTPPSSLDQEGSEYFSSTPKFVMSPSRDSLDDGSNDGGSLANGLSPFEEVLITSDDCEENEDEGDPTAQNVALPSHSETSIDTDLADTNNSPYLQWLLTTDIGDPTKLDINCQIQFGLNETLSHHKLSSVHIEKLIELYEAHPRIWDPNHEEFNEREKGRQSWQMIAQQWNKYCGRNFSSKAIHVRMGTLCKRFRKQCEDILENGESQNAITFKYYHKMQFLIAQQPFATRRAVFETQNRLLLDIYKLYPELWHTDQRNHCKSLQKRQNAFEGISKQMEMLHSIKLPAQLIQQRIKRLRKCYRLYRIRQLNLDDRVGRDRRFKYYSEMAFLYEHIDPFLCRRCGELFKTLKIYRHHIFDCEFQTGAKQKEIQSDSRQLQLEYAKECPSETTDHVISDSENAQTATKNEEHVIAPTSPLLEPDSTTEFTDLMPCRSGVDCVWRDLDKISKVEETALDWLLQEPSDRPDKDETNLRTKSLKATNSNCVNGPSDETAKVTSAKETLARLTVEQTRKLIALYQKFPQLWNPDHLEYASRKMRHTAWRALTSQINRKYDLNYSWCTIHRKITDYTKYYKRERERVEAQESCSKWYFYNDFAFVDNVIGIGGHRLKVLKHKEDNLKIIEIYKDLPQLWNTQHTDYSKRKERQNHFETMCKRLRDEARMEMSIEKLKQRIIEFRYNYRSEKQQRLHGQAKVQFYEFSDQLKFLENHISPFHCDQCRVNFKKLSDFIQHKRKVHSATLNSAKEEADSTGYLSPTSSPDNICHICGMKLTTRGNLVYHLKRHLDQRSHVCSMCPKAFFNSTALRVHERSHTKDQPYMCEICGHSYVNASKLNQHRKRHLNQRDYACIKCDKTFYTAFELERHERRHLNIRDKICSICGRAFFVGSSYYAHMRIHSDTKRYSCEICGRHFAQYPGLYKHRKRYHAKDCLEQKQEQ